MARLVRAGEGQGLDLPGRRSVEVISGAMGAASSTLRLVEIDPGPVTRGPHVHFGLEEVIHVLEGQALLKTETGDLEMGAGDTALVPGDERHQTLNIGEGVLKLLCSFPVADIRPRTREFGSWDHA